MTQRGMEGEENSINFVDMAAVLVRRRWAFLPVAVFVTMVGIAYVGLKPDVYRYTSAYQIGQDDEEPFKKPAEVIATIENKIIPSFEHEYFEKHSQRPPVNYRVRNPKDTLLIRLATNAPDALGSMTRDSHEQLLESIHQLHVDEYNKRQSSLTEQIAGVERVIEVLQDQQSGGGEPLAAAYKQLSDLQSRKADMEPGGILVRAQKSLAQVGFGSVLIVTVSLILGVLMGVVNVGVLEFSGAVRRKLKSQANGESL